jgi:hypothetical protein
MPNVVQGIVTSLTVTPNLPENKVFLKYTTPYWGCSLYTDIEKPLYEHGSFLFKLWLILFCKEKIRIKCKPRPEEMFTYKSLIPYYCFANNKLQRRQLFLSHSTSPLIKDYRTTSIILGLLRIDSLPFFTSGCNCTAYNLPRRTQYF